MKIGIVGARLAGSYAAYILAELGHEVILFDPGSAGEKACGGGVTSKALSSIAWLPNRHSLPYRQILTVELSSEDGNSAEVRLTRPIEIFSRARLDEAIRNEAIKAGASFRAERILRIQHLENSWGLLTSEGCSHEVEFLVGADGAQSAVRAQVSEKFRADDLSLALGYYVPGCHHPEKVVIVFQESGFHGYLWSFPRIDHASVGIVRRLPGVQSADLKRRVESFISARYPDAVLHPENFYAATIPCLSRNSLITQRVCGPDWALIGDAAGFADAVTSEGIYFALRSAEILGESFRAADILDFERRWRADFGTLLDFAAGWRDRFYVGMITRQPIAKRVVDLIRRSSTARRITDAVISGDISYRRIRSRMLSCSPKILAEALRSLIAHGA